MEEEKEGGNVENVKQNMLLNYIIKNVIKNVQYVAKQNNLMNLLETIV